MSKAISDYTRTQKYKDIKKAMLHQLKEQGADEKHYIDLINTYLECWIDVQILNKDIRTRGINVEVTNRAGDPELRKNESVGERTRIIAMMLRIWASLGLNQNAPQKPRLPDAPANKQQDQRVQEPLEDDEDDEDF